MRILGNFFLWIMLALPGPLAGQAAYFLANDEVIPLTTDRQSLSLLFAQPVAWEAVISPDFSAITRVEASKQAQSKRLVVWFDQPQALELKALLSQVLIDGAALTGAAWGQTLASGTPLWLTHQLMCQRVAGLAAQPAFQELIRAHGATLLPAENPVFYLLRVTDPAQALPLANALVEEGLTAWAHPDFMTPVRNLNDPLYPLQYFLNNTGQTVNGQAGTIDMDVDAPEAWTLSTGDPSLVIGIVDDGVEPHEDLEDDLGNSRVLPGYSPADTNSIGAPEIAGEHHGVAVAGLIGASHNSLGGKGMAPEVKFLPVYLEIALTTPISFFAQGITWAADNGADIIHNGWGYFDCTPNLFPSVTNAVLYAQSNGRGGKGSLVVFSAGANGPGRSCVAFPANLSEPLVVSSVTKTGALPDYVPFGPSIDLVVPSASTNANPDVRTTDRMNALGVSSNNYMPYFGGTSTSAAVATGAVALMLAENPDLTVAEITSILNSTADDMLGTGKDDTTGYGRLNAYQAVLAAQNAANNGGLPVEWNAVEALVREQGIVLRWETRREVNHDHFVVERASANGFVPLATIAGRGAGTPYQFLDAQPQPGFNRYRLRQVDLDGQFSFSPQAEAFWPEGGAWQLRLFSSHGQGPLLQMVGAPAGRVSLRCLDLQGREVWRQALAEGETTADLNWAGQVPGGLYLFQATNATGEQVSQKWLHRP